jgi:hypothetical protein
MEAEQMKKISLVLLLLSTILFASNEDIVQEIKDNSCYLGVINITNFVNIYTYCIIDDVYIIPAWKVRDRLKRLNMIKFKNKKCNCKGN